MGNHFFKGNRDEEEQKIHKRAVIDSKKKKIINTIYIGLFFIATTFFAFISGGLVLLIDGGITISFIITQLTISLYDKISEKYMKNIPLSEKRDFKKKIHEFYAVFFNE